MAASLLRPAARLSPPGTRGFTFGALAGVGLLGLMFTLPAMTQPFTATLERLLQHFQ